VERKRIGTNSYVLTTCPICKKDRWVSPRYFGSLCINCYLQSVRKPKKAKRTLEERFWSKVIKTETCWLWQGCKKGEGIKQQYGGFKIKGKMYVAHRVVWFLTYGTWPSQWVLHKCDNPPCVNPDHLFEGTPKDNTQDSIKKGRFLRHQTT
jgi:HNH endonuclease